MAKYSYKAVDAGGKPTKGTYEAENLQDFRCLRIWVSDEKVGTSSAASTPMMAITTISSMSVKALFT